MYVDHLHLRRSFTFFRSIGSRQDHDLHVHECLEIGVLLKNELSYRFGNETYHGVPGDVFLCRPFEPHWSYPASEEPFESIIILFAPGIVRKLPEGKLLLSPFYTNQGIQPLIPSGSSYAQAIKDAACLGLKAQEEGISAWETRQYLCLVEILLQIHRWEIDSTGVKEVPTSDVTAAVGWMLDHFKQPLDVEGLAKRAGMGRSLFFEEFQRLTGLTPGVFLTRLRIQYAMDVLRSTKQTVLKTADESGFESLSTFNKQFKRYTGMAPREYRKQQKTKQMQEMHDRS